MPTTALNRTPRRPWGAMPSTGETFALASWANPCGPGGALLELRKGGQVELPREARSREPRCGSRADVWGEARSTQPVPGEATLSRRQQGCGSSERCRSGKARPRPRIAALRAEGGSFGRARSTPGRSGTRVNYPRSACMVRGQCLRLLLCVHGSALPGKVAFPGMAGPHPEGADAGTVRDGRERSLGRKTGPAPAPEGYRGWERGALPDAVNFESRISGSCKRLFENWRRPQDEVPFLLNVIVTTC